MILITDKNIYYIVYSLSGNAMNSKTGSEEKYDPKNRRYYIRKPAEIISGIFNIPSPHKDVFILIYEQQGKMPSAKDAIIKTIGDVTIAP